ncbi:MAG TPA: hypothetical protein VI998_01645 [Patescibacteria group bacterium]|nr:hypothetical protein [Patescibacteria group bacterium]
MRRPIFFILIFFCIFFAALTAYAASQILVTVSINPLEVNADANGNIQVNKIFTLKARIDNDGNSEIKNITAELFVPGEIILVSGEPIQNIGRIPGKRHKDVRWKLKAAARGQYVATVRAQGINKAGESISSEASALLIVKEKRGFWHFFDRLTEIFDDAI